MKLKEILDEISKENDAVVAILDESDAKQNGDLTPEQRSTIVKHNKKIEELELKATETKEGDAMREAADKRREHLKTAARLPMPTGKEGLPGHPSQEYEAARQSLKSNGQTVIDNPEFKAWYEKTAVSGRIANRTSIQTPAVEVKTLLTGASNTSAGAMVWSERLDTVNRAPFRPLNLLDLISKGETTSDAIDYAIITGYINNAAAVAEATAVTGTSGTKPESGINFDVVAETVKTIAHWIPATNRALADAAQLRTLIDTFLTFGLGDRLENLMLTGDGTGENFRGILNTPGLQVQAYTTDIVVTTRKARTKVKTPGRVTPTAYLMNPLDWEAFDLLRENGATGAYIYGGPSVLGQPRLWGVPVVESEAMPVGRALTGDFRYAMLWDRMQAVITASNSHADFFIRNLVAILAEMRAAFGVLYPKGFVDVDLDPAP